MIFSLKEMYRVLCKCEMGGSDMVKEENFRKRVLFGLRSTAKMELNGEGDIVANVLGRGKGMCGFEI